MELAILITVAVLFSIAGLVCVVSVAIGLPGAWMILGLAIVIEAVDSLYLGEGQPQTFGWWLLAACAVLALLGEILEFVAGALGAGKAGSSKTGMLGALIGGVLGAILGIALPLPIIGSLVGAVVGTFAGAIIGEMSATDATVRESLRPATGATIGRVLGALSKIPIAMAIWVSLSVAAFWP